MRVIWTKEARNRPGDIRAYIAQDSPLAAARVVDAIIKRAQQLAIVPGSGRPVSEYPDNSVRELLERPYRLLYQQVGQEVFILTVMHYRQRLPRRLHDLASDSGSQ